MELSKKDFRNFTLYYTEELGVSSARVNRLMSMVRTMLEFATNEDDYDYEINYASKVKGLPKEAVREIVFLPNEAIMALYNYFMDNVHDFQISCFKFGWMNPWWAMTLDDDMKAEKLFPETGEKRSQDLQDLFCPTGAIWIANVEALKQSGTFYGDNYRAFPIEWTSAVDIDNYDDLKMAKLLDNMNKEDEE